jgi:arachidonate 15-lipoxygenase
MITADETLQAWAHDIATEGNVNGMPDKIDSVDQLVGIITTVIFICGPQHSAVNFPQVCTLPGA